MKKVSFRNRNFGDEQFLTYNIDNEADLDEEVLDYLEEEEPEGIVPVIFDDSEEEFDTFSYNITNKIHLADLSNQEVSAEMVLMVLRGMVITLSNMAEYRIPLSYLVLHRNYIYIDSDYKVEFICIPLEDMQEDVDINNFLRSFLSNIRFDSTENGDYVAKLLTYINTPAIFTLRNLLSLVEELMDDYGIEIPDDNDDGLTVDYEEVLEEEEAKEDLEEPVVEEVAEEDAEEIPEEIFEEPVSEEVSEVASEPEVDFNVPLNDYEEEDYTISMADEEDEEEAVAEEPDIEEDGVDQAALEEAKDLINRIKQQVMEEKKNNNTNILNPGAKDTEEYKTQDSSSTVMHDDLDDFLEAREKEEKLAPKEQGIKMKKSIKVNRASIVNSNKEEQALSDEEEARIAEAQEAAEAEDNSGSILSQTISATGLLKGATVPKANPYLIRVNTEDRIMITKQVFKIGKASMGVDYSVRGNGAVSRVHAVISNRDDVYYIKDNKSTNHTYVNGKVVDEGNEELLTHDSKIMLGDEEFIFKLR